MLKGIENLKKYVDSLIIIPNDKITQVVPKGTPMVEALRILHLSIWILPMLEQF